jgi:hypothetical protein
MSDEEHTLLLIRGTIASFPLEEISKFEDAYSRIRRLEAEFGREAFLLAIALIGAEEAAK